MEETKNLWNKTSAELTVKDIAVVNVGAVIIVIATFAAVGVTLTVAEKIRHKFRKSEDTETKTDTPEMN